MATIEEAFDAGVDAVIADNTLNRGGFVDAMQTVITDNFSNAEGNAFVDALAILYGDLGQLNPPGTYNKLRGDIISDGDVLAKSKFRALAVVVNALPEAVPVLEAASLTGLRDDRDQINAAITRCDDLIAAEPGGTVGRLVKDVLCDGKRSLREYKEQVRDQIRNILGDPDA